MRYSSLILLVSLSACGVEHDPELAAADPALAELEQGCGTYGGFIDPLAVANGSAARPSEPARLFAERHAWLADAAAVDVLDHRTRLVAALHDARAALAQCEPRPGASFEERVAEADLRITRFDMDGILAPGETVTFTVGLAEVSGVGHMRYPGVGLAFDPPVARVPEFAGALYGLDGCQEWVFELPVTLAEDVAPDVELSVSALAGLAVCPDGVACLSDDAVLMRQAIER